ncbi:MAG TPA: hypothetical protein VG983_07600 [Caulobacterales bacterium]|nr:hypothetical protein [Caulobacterales bacterium]
MTATTIDPERASAGASGRYGYVWLAGLCVFIALAGFAPTFWLPMAAHKFQANPIVYVHGFWMTGWTFFLLYQAWLAASGNVRRHRAVGMIGVSYFTALFIFAMLIAMNSVRVAPAIYHENALKFLIVSLSGFLYVLPAMILAFANTHRPEVHKRLIFTSTLFMLEAAVGRWFLLFLAPPPDPNAAPGAPPPVMVALGPGIVVDLIMIGLMVADWRTRGKAHPVYLISLPIIAALQLLQVPVSNTGAWLSFAEWFVRLAG